MKEYRFYGAGCDKISPANDEYKIIKDQFDLYDALCEVWCAETCAPRMREGWSKENPTYGQCSITAFLFQDIFGGEVYGVALGDGNYHCYNAVNGAAIDLTSEQFLPKTLDYSDPFLQSREEHFAKTEKYERYLLLKKRLAENIKNRLLNGFSFSYATVRRVEQGQNGPINVEYRFCPPPTGCITVSVDNGHFLKERDFRVPEDRLCEVSAAFYDIDALVKLNDETRGAGNFKDGTLSLTTFMGDIINIPLNTGGAEKYYEPIVALEYECGAPVNVRQYENHLVPQTGLMCGAPAPAGGWFCAYCGTYNLGKFCTECGKKKI